MNALMIAAAGRASDPMTRRLPLALLSFALLAPLAAARPVLAENRTTLILTGAEVWTGDDQRPRARAVALAGDRVLAVGAADEVLRYRNEATRVLELGGRFVVPGFIDNHTHFDSAGALILGVNLLDVADAEGLHREVAAARDRLPAGSWITGGDWGPTKPGRRARRGRPRRRATRSSAPTAP